MLTIAKIMLNRMKQEVLHGSRIVCWRQVNHPWKEEVVTFPSPSAQPLDFSLLEPSSGGKKLHIATLNSLGS